MTPDREALVAEVAGMLAKHWDYDISGDCDRWHCACGDQIGDRATADLDASQQAHLAHALADLLAAREQQTRAEAWDAAVASAYLHETEHWMGIKHDPNPYREATP